MKFYLFKDKYGMFLSIKKHKYNNISKTFRDVEPDLIYVKNHFKHLNMKNGDTIRVKITPIGSVSKSKK